MATYDTPLEINLPRLQFSYEYVGDHAFIASGSINSVGNIYCATNFAFTDWRGNKHPFENVSTCNWHLGGPNSPMVNVTDASDGSFYRLDTTDPTDIKVYAKNGTVYHFYGFSNLFPNNSTSIASFDNQENYYDARAGLIVDPNGNQIKIQTSFSGNNTIYTVTDTLGRTITISPTEINYDDSTGQPQTISISTTAASTTTNYDFELGCSYAGQEQEPPYVTPTVTTLSEFTGIPTSTTTTITFPPSAGGGTRQYQFTFGPINRLVKIQYPYGGYTRYDYGSYNAFQTMGSVQCSIGNFGEVAHKYECSSADSTSCTEATTTYAPTVYSGEGGVYNSSETITDPLGDKTVDSFSTTNPVRTNPEQTDVKKYSPSGALLRTIHYDYPTITPSASGAGYWSFDYDFPSSITTTYYNPTVSSIKTYTYEPYSSLPNYQSGIIDNPTEIDTTGYNGNILSKISEQWEPASAFSSSSHILDRLESRMVANSADTLFSEATYGYDLSGNIIKKTITGNDTGELTTLYQHNSYGEITEITDPLQLTTQIGYGDQWSDSSQTCVPANSSSYPTSITNALGQTTKYTYNACSGTIASIIDPNGVTSSYTYDAVGRVLCRSVKDANSAVTANACNTYVDSAPSSITENIAENSSANVTKTSILDGFGRAIQNILTSAPNEPVYKDITYDPLGRVQSVSNPYYSTSDPTYGVTSYLYDALGRKTTECHQDNGTAGSLACVPGKDYSSWSYNGNVVTYTDENGNQWQRTYDALGRLTQVEEPNGASKPPSMVTNYSYDALGNLLEVDQQGGSSSGSGDRIRTFSYNSLSELMDACNPEAISSGSTCTSSGPWSDTYTYDADGNVLSKTDARGITTNYKYDALNRLLQKSYADGASADPTDTPLSCYEYDVSSSTFSGFTPSNLVGRLSNEWTQPSGTSCGSAPASGGYITLDAFSYDPMGRVLTEEECTPANCATSTPYSMNYTYDLAGDTLTSTDGLASTPGTTAQPLTFTYGWNGAEWLQSVTSNWNPSDPNLTSEYPPQLMSVQSFWPMGAVKAMTYGNGLTLNRTYDTRLRITGETDTGSVRTYKTPGTATITITGADQSQ